MQLKPPVRIVGPKYELVGEIPISYLHVANCASCGTSMQASHCDRYYYHCTAHVIHGVVE